MTSIGEQLITIGKLSPVAFRSYLHIQCSRDQQLFLHKLRQRLHKHGADAPSFRKSMLRLIDNVNHSSRNPSSVVPVDLEHALGPHQAFTKLQEYFSLYGELLCAWSTLFEAAVGMKAQLRPDNCSLTV
jgi:hypothetical protein